MKTDRRTSTAYHEAGHAVIAFALSKKLHKVSVRADHDAGLLGYVKSTSGIGKTIEYGDPDTYQRRVTENATILLAGVVAEQEHTKKRHNWAGARSDMNNAFDLVCRIMPPGPTAPNEPADEATPFLKWLMVRTRNLVRWRWPAIEALAKELLVREEMSGKDATAFIRNTLYPAVTAEEAAQLAAQFATTATR